MQAVQGDSAQTGPRPLHPEGPPPLQGLGTQPGPLPQGSGLRGASQQEVADEELQALTQQAQRRLV